MTITTPIIATASGLGTGGGAGVENVVGGGQSGDVLVKVGPDYSPSGSIAMDFSAPVSTCMISGDQAFGAISSSIAGSVVTISWTGAAFPSTAEVGSDGPSYYLYFQNVS